MAVSILDTLDIIATQIPILPSEIIPIEDSLGRIVMQDYHATFDLPRFDNSAMDGYAVKVGNASKKVSCKQTIYAGDENLLILQENTAIKIMTGAPIPQGTESIVPIENVVQDKEQIQLPKDIVANAFIRIAGEDIKKGTVYLKKHTRINAYTIASLASQGVTHISVTRKIKVAVFGTGDELRPHYEKIEAHQLYNSNSPMFLARSKQLGCEVRFVPTVSDSIEALESAIKSTLDADIIITSGGVSVGDKDFTKEAFTNLGMKVIVDKIDIKPGRPTIIGMIKETVVVNLPGNPLAAMVNYELFVRAIIRKLSGQLDKYHHSIKTIMKEDFKVRGGKYAVVLGRFNGASFEALQPQMPGMVSPMQYADGCLLIEPNTTKLSAGQSVNMLTIKWEYCSEKVEVLFS